MTVNSLTADLMVEDVVETADWYGEVFDAEVVARLPEDSDEPWWVQLRIDEASLMVQNRDSLSEKLPTLEGASIGGSMALYVDIDDAEALHDSLSEAGVKVVQDLHETEFGWRQFAVEDCNGYILWFGEKLEDEETLDIGRRQRALVRRHHG